MVDWKYPWSPVLSQGLLWSPAGQALPGAQGRYPTWVSYMNLGSGSRELQNKEQKTMALGQSLVCRDQWTLKEEAFSWESLSSSSQIAEKKVTSRLSLICPSWQWRRGNQRAERSPRISTHNGIAAATSARLAATLLTTETKTSGFAPSYDCLH